MVRAARCDSCRFWQLVSPVEDEKGQCRIRPPVVLGDVVDSRSAWPHTYDDEWCGEWQEAYRKKADAGG